MAEQGSFVVCLYGELVVFTFAFEVREAFPDTKDSDVYHDCQNDGCSHGPDEVDVIQRDDHQDEIDDLGTGALFTEQVVHVNP